MIENVTILQRFQNGPFAAFVATVDHNSGTVTGTT